MPSKTASKPPARPSATADFDDYLLEGDLSDNPFRSPSPGASNPNKRKGPTSGLGIDEEVEVKKRVTVPRVKLDEARLLSENGIPKLRQRAKHLRLKGKGHEWSDAARLLSFYQIWLDDLFPKAKFLDALGMVEKAGHKGAMHKARMGWIEEGKPRDATSFGEEDDGVREEEVPREPSRIAPIFEQAKRTGSGSGDRERQKTPDVVDLFGDEDIYDATPKARKAAPGGGEADEDDLDALMAEAESAPVNSIFGGGGKPASSLFGGPVTAAAAANEPDGDDLDALLAEAEEQAPTKTTPAVSSIFGDGKPKQPAESREEDDLDALMAEVEADGAPSQPVPAKADAPKLPEGDGGPKDSFTDEEEAMAEMEGLW